MSPTTVAIAGATGNLGKPVLEALLAAGHTVTALTRPGSNLSKLPLHHPNLVVRQVDFQSADTIAPALEGVDVVVCCLSTAMMSSQAPLIDAAFAAGVTRFIPAEFGMDSANANCMSLPVVCAPKAATQAYLRSKHEADPRFTFTSIANGLFLDWGLEVGFIVDPARRAATLYNGGDVPFSVTLLSDVARAVVGVIGSRDGTANRVVYVQSAVTTQNRLIAYAREKDGRDWTTAVKDTKDLLPECLGLMEKGGEADVDTAIEGLCICGTMDPDFGADFSRHLDNELLGIEGLDEDGVRAVVHKFV